MRGIAALAANGEIHTFSHAMNKKCLTVLFGPEAAAHVSSPTLLMMRKSPQFSGLLSFYCL
ncbi:hypothetical protein ACMZ49_22735 [Alcaligenes phenolicus]|jgi:hypothetical protein|uniref:hypothetical protein n=1 Tax=Burkholderia contaminans TaxID=488447 RepID=UPI0018DCC46F|nr:hypothetical protein [Burkholderia contaminans]MBH9668045.1 hypothetical protein [Burkholderia contaminans]MBH9678212.1 hypothetical protein [Burkholderia contaminans]MBH9705359.1 hypothetical protein [Burkholderia contaminans]